MSDFPCRLILLSALLLLVSHPTHAQDEPGASRAVSLSAYAGYSHLSPDYGPYNDQGFLVGGDIGRPFHHIMTSIDTRYTYGTGQGVKEGAILFGPKVEKKFGHINPYANFLLGYGTFNFTHPLDPNYTHDNSVVYDYGGGIDYDISRALSVKADLQYQKWRLGTEINPMTPVALSIGITCRLPFRPLHGRD